MSMYGGGSSDSIIEALRKYIKTYTGLKTNAPIWVHYLDYRPVQYSIFPLAGARVISEDIVGNRLMEFTFAMQSMESTSEDIDRLESSGFYESFAQWLDDQTRLKVFPNLQSDQKPESIEALGWGIMFQQGDDETAIYQIQCRLVYMQKISILKEIGSNE